jgi:hypothetical protein
MEDIGQKFLELFDGYELAYGQHNNFVEDGHGKLNGRAQTIQSKVPVDIVKAHIAGTGASLGIIPLKQNNKCKFGAIDIDIKHPTNKLIHTIEEIEDKVNKLSLPLVVCQSKSKGIHLFCFTQKEIPAQILITKLKEWASLIGYGSAEISPKQYYRVNNQDIGSWINLPYYNAENTERFAINKKQKLSLEKFLEFANVMKISEKELIDFKIENLNDNYNDAPPCLQILSNYGVEEGSRNNGLYNFAVYFKNKFPDNWEEKIMEINGQIINPALSIKEVETIIKSINKKKYFYKCKEYPVCQFCNKIECIKRKYGIGSSVNIELTFDNLTKYIANDNTVVWYAEYQGKRIQLSTEELLNQKDLQRKLLNTVNKIFQPIKQQEWLNKVEQLLTNCVIVEDPEDASKKGQFRELFDSFLTGGVLGEDKRNLLSDSIYLDKNKNLIYFKSQNLFTYLKNKKFVYTEQEVWHWLKDMGANNTQLTIGNKRVRTWFITAPILYVEDVGDKLI